MSDPSKPPTLFSDAIRAELMTIVEEAVGKAMKNGGKPGAVEERLCDIDEAARILAVSPEWIYRNRKTLPFYPKARPQTLALQLRGHAPLDGVEKTLLIMARRCYTHWIP